MSEETTTTMIHSCGCKVYVSTAQLIEHFKSLEYAQVVYGSRLCRECDYEALSPEEKAHFDQAVAKAEALGYAFTEPEVLQAAWDAGWVLSLHYDPRFMKVEGRRDGLPLWNLVPQPVDPDNPRILAWVVTGSIFGRRLLCNVRGLGKDGHPTTGTTGELLIGGQKHEVSYVGYPVGAFCTEQQTPSPELMARYKSQMDAMLARLHSLKEQHRTPQGNLDAPFAAAIELVRSRVLVLGPGNAGVLAGFLSEVRGALEAIEKELNAIPF